MSINRKNEKVEWRKMVKIYDIIEENPVIAAVLDETQLNRALCSDAKVIFLLCGDLINVSHLVDKAKRAGKFVFVHMDLIQGLSTKEIGVDYIKSATKADGIISTHPKTVRRGKELGLYTVLRVFLMDSISLSNLKKNLDMGSPDFVEVMPAVMPKVLKRIVEKVRIPIISGGLIADKEDVMQCLGTGVLGISSSNMDIWDML